MTVAIATRFDQGTIICADTKTVDEIGNVSYRRKISPLPSFRNRRFSIAHASADANVAEMLAEDILLAIHHSNEENRFESIIKQSMTNWYKGFGEAEIPLIQFILIGAAANEGHIYFCQPPNIVRWLFRPVVIGSGQKIVEPLMATILGDGVYDAAEKRTAESTLLKLAYLMHKAKSLDIYAGGETNATVIWNHGEFAGIDPEEMKAAEEFSPKLDLLLKTCSSGLFSLESLDEQRAFLKRFELVYMDYVKEANKSWFPSLQRPF